MWLEPNTKFAHMGIWVHILGLLILLLWMNVLHSLKMSAFSLMHLPMPSCLLNINTLEHLASRIFLFSPNKHTNYAIFPQLKKNLILTLLTLLALIPSISTSLQKNTSKYILPSNTRVHSHCSPFRLLASFSTVSFVLSLALTCSWLLLTDCFFLVALVGSSIPP